MAEYRMAVARIKGAEVDNPRRKPLQLIIVVTALEQIPPSAHEFRLLRRPKTITDDAEDFIVQLGQVLRGIANENGTDRLAEPQRLLEAKEYRAAVISAMTLLETRLRELLDNAPWRENRRPQPIRSLFDQAVEHGLLPEESRLALNSWMRARNAAVHSATIVSKAQADEIVTSILALLYQL